MEQEKMEAIQGLDQRSSVSGAGGSSIERYVC